MAVTTLTMVMTLIVVLGLALDAVNGNSRGHGLAHALEVLSREPRPKLKALELLAKLADIHVMPALVQVLRDSDGRVRVAAQNVMWTIWLRSGNDQIDTLMAEGIRLMEAAISEAVEVLDQIIARAPTFAEGYNKRATVYYLMLEFEKSIADIHRTLELEFGALRRPQRHGAMLSWPGRTPPSPGMVRARRGRESKHGHHSVIHSEDSRVLRDPTL